MNDIAAVFKALCDPTRLAVFNCIRCGDDGNEVAVCRIRCQVPCAPSTLTHHLNELRAAGMITTEKRGRIVYCRVRTDALARIGAFALGNE